ncbi:MAG: S41 family peptidase, partial [Verrucomicrobiota bacterium]
KEYRTPSRKGHLREYPMAVLINHASASGAEVVSGALQDLRRALIVGETSFGKGSVQSIIPIPLASSKGSAVRLTTAKYYTPSKKTIHENGVTPNIISAITMEDERNLMRWFRRETLTKEEREKLDAWHDRQLARAVDALKGALIFEGLQRGPGRDESDPESPSLDGEASTKEVQPTASTENTSALKSGMRSIAFGDE